MSALAAGYELTFDQSRIDAAAAHAFLTRSYWSTGIPFETVARAIANSLCVATFCDGKQVGFARVVTDRATFAYLADVYVLKEHRGKGLAQGMVHALHEHPELQGLRRWMLATLDAHRVYSGLGWTTAPDPSIFMQRHFPEVYS